MFVIIMAIGAVAVIVAVFIVVFVWTIVAIFVGFVVELPLTLQMPNADSTVYMNGRSGGCFSEFRDGGSRLIVEECSKRVSNMRLAENAVSGLLFKL